ncbi:hypothetical protein SVIOM342S_03014 [Streptomyces violaceorubidus]
MSQPVPPASKRARSMIESCGSTSGGDQGEGAGVRGGRGRAGGFGGVVAGLAGRARGEEGGEGQGHRRRVIIRSLRGWHRR